ncbi:MAG: V-type ATP synthase subunit K [Thermoplasmata archaeon]
MGDLAAGMVAIAAGLTLFGTAIGTAWAEKVIGGAAIGVMAEKPELFGRGLVLMVIPETIIIFGFVIGIILVGLIPGVAEAGVVP